MQLRYKIVGGIGAVLLVGIVALAVTLSHNSACPAATTQPSGVTTMMAIVSRCYGSPDTLEYSEIARPEPADDEVLVKIRAASVNPLDWHFMRGSPYIMRLQSGLGSPADTRMGVDFAGTVAAVGKGVTLYKPGDDVFGRLNGAFAEFGTIREDRAMALKPDNMSFEQAAAVPIAAVTALQALRDLGNIAPGMKVLINGASGGVGTFAVQIAKANDAQVTGVCSTRNVELVQSIGADHVIDYTQQNYTEGEERYDLIIDNVGNHSLLANRQVLTPNGTLVLVGGPKGNWLGPLAGPLKALVLTQFIDQEMKTLMARIGAEDMLTLSELMEAGKLIPVLDKSYPLSEVPAAIAYSETGRARGKIIIEMD